MQSTTAGTYGFNTYNYLPISGFFVQDAHTCFTAGKLLKIFLIIPLSKNVLLT